MAAVSRFLLGATLVSALGVTAMNAEAADWQPNKPVQMVIMAGQGGGADRLARLFQSVIQQNRLSPMPVLPVNKGGGSGAEALRYLKDNAGDPHIIMATLNSYYTTPLRTDIGVDVENFTPLARMATDTFILWVNADSGITNLEEYVQAVEDAGGSWKMGGTGSGQEDSLITAMMEQEFGVNYTYVPFNGGGTVAKNLIGNHIDSTVNNPSEQMAFYQAGKSVPLATFTEERLDAFPDVPTMRELGHDLVYTMQRSFVAPADIPEEAEQFYVELFTALHETEEWQQYASEQALLTDFITTDTLQDYLLTERGKHAELLKVLGELPTQ